MIRVSKNLLVNKLIITHIYISDHDIDIWTTLDRDRSTYAVDKADLTLWFRLRYLIF